MAKFDTYNLTVRIGDEKEYANLSLTVLFEEGDVVPDVLSESASLLKTEVQNLKRQKFLDKVKS